MAKAHHPQACAVGVSARDGGRAGEYKDFTLNVLKDTVERKTALCSSEHVWRHKSDGGSQTAGMELAVAGAFPLGKGPVMSILPTQDPLRNQTK